MNPFPSNLTPEDRRTYRRWVRGMFLTYLVGIIGIAATSIGFPRSANDLRASNETQIDRLKGPTGSVEVSPAAMLTAIGP